MNLAHQIHTFNTGRCYGPQKQRIAWTIQNINNDSFGISYLVAFYDVDRGINGVVILDKEPTDDALLYVYDRCEYTTLYDQEISNKLLSAANAI